MQVVGRLRPTCSCSTSSAARSDGVRAFLERSGATAPGESQLIPVLRARVIGVAGRETNLESVEDVRQRGVSLGREFTITYRDHLESNERVVDGRVLERRRRRSRKCRSSSGSARAVRASHVGDTMRFDILGRTISAAGHQHPRRRVARLAQRRLHVRVPAGRARPGAADLHRAAQGARAVRRRARDSSTIWSSSFRTCR